MNDPEHNQVGGSHYKDLPIQPARYIAKNGIGFLEGFVIKRMTRYNRPTGKGLQDLEKAKHEIELLMKFEKERQEGQHSESSAPEEAPAVILPDGRPAYKFDLGRALAGDPIVTRSGKEMSNFRRREFWESDRNYPYIASDTTGIYFTYTEHGEFFSGSPRSEDLFMLHPANQTEPTEKQQAE